MCHFCLIAALVFALPMHLHAQTIQQFVKSYPDGSPDTVWHIKNRDTFLIETFRRNGTLEKRSWHQDSVYTFYESGQIESKMYQPNNYSYPKLTVFLRQLRDIPDRMQQKKMFYPNGKLQSIAQWSGDSLWTFQEWLPNGTLKEQEQVRQRKVALIEHVETSKYGRVITLFDTLQKLKTIYTYYPNAVLKKKQLYRLTQDKAAYWRKELLEMSTWDAQSNLQAAWVDSPQHIKPFKNNGLCLYGFVNAKQDTVLTAQFENIKTIHNQDNTTYYLVNNAQHYGILNEKGDYVLRPVWDFLACMEERPDYQNETEMLDQLLLRCRTASGVGVLKMNGEFALKPVYQDVRNYKKDSFEVKINGHYGIVDKAGNVIVAPLYYKIHFTPYPDVFEIQEIVKDKYDENRYSLIHKTGKILLPSLFKRLETNDLPDSCFITPVFGDGSYASASKRGIFHLKKGWLVDTLYDWPFYEKKYAIVSSVSQKLQGLLAINTAKLLLPCEYRFLSKIVNAPFHAQTNKYLSDTYYIGAKNRQWGLFDPKQAVWKLPLQYEYLHEFQIARSNHESILIACKNNKYQFINIEGDVLLPLSFDAAGQISKAGLFSKDALFMVKGDSVFFYSKYSFPRRLTFAEVFKGEPQLQKLETFDNQTIIINTKQKIIVSKDFSIKAMEKKYVIVYDQNTTKQFLIDTLGNKREFTSKYEVVEINIAQNLIIVQDTNNRKLGVVTVDGKTILPCDYFSIYSPDEYQFIWAKKSKSNRFCEELQFRNPNFYRYMEKDRLTVFDGGLQLFNPMGKLLIPIEFDYTFNWSNGIGIGQVQGKQGLWDTTGRNLIPPRYDKIWYDGTNEIYYLFYIQNNDNQLVGFADKKGKIIKEAVFKNMSCFTGKYAFVETAQGIGLIQQNSNYWIAPSPYALQQSTVDLNEMFKKEVDALRKLKKISYSIPLFQIHPPYTSHLKPFEPVSKKVPLEQQLFVNNLLVQLCAPSHFLLGNRVVTPPTQSIRYSLYDCSDEEDWLHNDECNDYFTKTQKVANRLHLGDLQWSQKYIGFWIDNMHLSKYPPSCGTRSITYESYNFKREDGVWNQVELDNLLVLNEQNIRFLNQLFVQKLSEIKDFSIDCSNPSGYVEHLKNSFFVTEHGLQFQVAAHPYYNELRNTKPLLLTWEELKPILK